MKCLNCSEPLKPNKWGEYLSFCNKKCRRLYKFKQEFRILHKVSWFQVFCFLAGLGLIRLFVDYLSWKGWVYYVSIGPLFFLTKFVVGRVMGVYKK